MDLKTLERKPPWEWPEDADEILLGILRDDQSDESDRFLAVELAGDCVVINDALVDVLLSTLRSGDESEKMRGRAAIALGPILELAWEDGFDDDDFVRISEQTYRTIQETFRKLYMDAGIPKEVRRRIMEASVRAPRDWHPDAVRAAYISDDEDWKLTAVFSMQYVRGFQKQILESLDSENPDIHYEAVCAAGNWALDAAWQHIIEILEAKGTEKYLLLAAIEAATQIRPRESADYTRFFIDSDDQDIVDAAFEVMGMVGALDDLDEDESMF